MEQPKKRDRSGEAWLLVSPAHKAKLKQYCETTKRTAKAETELWIDGLKV